MSAPESTDQPDVDAISAEDEAVLEQAAAILAARFATVPRPPRLRKDEAALPPDQRQAWANTLGTPLFLVEAAGKDLAPLVRWLWDDRPPGWYAAFGKAHNAMNALASAAAALIRANPQPVAPDQVHAEATRLAETLFDTMPGNLRRALHEAPADERDQYLRYAYVALGYTADALDRLAADLTDPGAAEARTRAAALRPAVTGDGRPADPPARAS